ncbi:Tubulin polyglutamylase TTLL4 [Nymphon striatum]|nr:Tubulin polyglutamylase TTLL4 [Nymphon striatum]
MPLPSEIRRHLRWKLSTITPIIMRKTVTRAGISLTKSTTDWCGTWGKQVKVVSFKAIKSYQKVNHFPWTFQIGRKDKLWRNVWRMRMKHGHAGFHFLPQTYILPHDIKALKKAWENLNQKKPRARHKWIVKPPASARGQGIKVIHKWSQIPKKWPLIVQKYIANPYLINGSKFDLRLYVLVTSFDPLRIYVFNDGLVRFASVKYSANVKSLNDKFMHLTNYSINKKSSSYTANEDIHACQGHKWSLNSLWRYMQKEGINTKSLWENINDIIIKTIISCEASVTGMMKRYVKTQFNCYELFGFDIMLDEKLKPWLLEVNISPSLHSNSPLDASIKGQLAKDLLNLAGFHVPNRISENSKSALLTKLGFSPERSSLCHDKKLYNYVLSAEERAKIFQFQQIHLTLGTTEMSVLDNLTPDDIKHLMISEDELTRAGHFNRVYPSLHSNKYHKYFEQPRYYDNLLDAWEVTYFNNRSMGIQRLQKLYRNHCDAEKKAETKITCKMLNDLVGPKRRAQKTTTLCSSMSGTKSSKVVRRRSLEIGINRRSLQIMLKELNYNPYVPRLIHGLIGDDTDRRLQLCGIFVNQCEATPTLPDTIVWTDAAQFKLSGNVNRDNCSYWASEKPCVTIEKQLNKPSIAVLAGISSSGIIGQEFSKQMKQFIESRRKLI